MRYNYLLLSDLLRSKRIERNYSIRGLSRIVGISDTELSRIENGERKNFNLITLINLCEVLEIDFIKLLKVTGYLSNNYLIQPNHNLDGDFKINPKKIGKENVGCSFCPYKDICFYKEEDIVCLEEHKTLDFLKEGDIDA